MGHVIVDGLTASGVGYYVAFAGAALGEEVVLVDRAAVGGGYAYLHKSGLVHSAG